jgi:hypothetical protein
MCLRFATMVNVITTSKDHELHLPTCTAVHAPNWFGLFNLSDYDARGSGYPHWLAGDWRCGYYNPSMGNFLCPPDGEYLWKELNFNFWHA